MPKSRVRTKSVYTPPARPVKSKVGPRWVLPAMLTTLLIGLAWISTFYVSGGGYPVGALSDWNVVVGFGFIVAGVVISTKWR